MDKFPHKIIGGGAVILALTVAFGWGGFNMIIRGQLKQQARLFNKTDTMRNWLEAPQSFHLRLYIFHIENPEEIVKGAKPKLKERGPYVYKEKRWKDEVYFDKGNDTLKYKHMKMYEFLPDMSDGNKEDDMITIINAPLVGVSRIAQDSSNKAKVLEAIGGKLSDKAEQLFVTHPVKELLWDGYGATAYQDIGTEHNEAMMSESGGDFMVPDFLMDGKFGLFERNNSDDGEYEIGTGRMNGSAYGLVKYWNGLDILPFWPKGNPCYLINGTDGTLFNPPMKKSTVLTSFDSDHCRVIKYTYEMDSEVKEVKTLRFKPKKEHLLSPQNYPDNACYCPFEDLAKCDMDGVEFLAPCMQAEGQHYIDPNMYFVLMLTHFGNLGMPMFISKPHFLDADQKITDTVEGLMPDPEKHETYLDIHGAAGYIMEGKKRWQISIELIPIPEIPMLASAPKSFVPLYWVEQSTMEVDGKFSLLRFLATLQKGCDTVRWGFLVTGAAMVVIGIVIALTRRGSSKVDRITLLQ